MSEKDLKVSIFTPTHNTKYLEHLYKSIKDQDFYEWVIVTNNGAVVEIEDPRIKVFNYEHTFVGALKKYACLQCTGDILLEVDHDDLLLPRAIKEVKKAFQDDEIGFVYSNSASFRNNFEAVDKFDEKFGWKFRDFNYNNHILNEVVSFEPNAHSVSKIWFAPDHLRAWRKSIYNQVGGHAEDMRVLDDQDLISRTYLITKFKHIDKCLYLYRHTGENTWLIHNEEIQNNVFRLYNKYILDLAIRWSELNGLRKLDFGGQFNGHEKLECVDIAINGVDLSKTFPYEDNSVGLIRANDILEHIPDKLHVIKEIYRVLAPNGILLATTPNAMSQGAFQDPTHCAYYVKNSFKYYTEQRYAQYIGTPVRFQELQPIIETDAEEHPDKISWIVAHLLAIKNQDRICGEINI